MKTKIFFILAFVFILNFVSAADNFNISSSAGNHLLFVNGTSGDVNILKNLNVTGTIYGSVSGDDEYWNVSGDYLFPYDLSKNVGIGTNNPGALLHAYSANSIAFSDLSKASILAGTTSLGVGIDSNEIIMKGGVFHVGTIDAQPMIFYTNATEKIRITSGGDVGIGTSSPGAKLVLRGTAIGASFEGVIIEDNAADRVKIGYMDSPTDTSIVPAQLLWTSLGGTEVAGSLAIMSRGTSATGIGFFTSTGAGATERLRISKTGDVGIGTTSPDSKLHIVGENFGSRLLIQDNHATLGDPALQLYVGTETPSSTDGWTIRNDRSDSEKLQWRYNNNPFWTIDTTGNVGIGTISPGAKLHAYNANSIAFSDLSKASILAGTTSLGVGIDSNEIMMKGGVFYVGTIDAQPMMFYTNATEKIRILANGNVGIGTTTPSEKLSLLGNNGGTFLKIHDQRSTTGDLAGIKLGTMPLGPIGNMKTMIAHIETGSYGTGDLVFALNPDASTDSEVDITDEVMRITSSGKVGIGTTSPEEKLSVSGGVNIWLG
jgi:hypothetical protein